MSQITFGFLLGFILVLPGMSGGTVLLIFGIYEKLIKDISKLNFKPYIPLMIGCIGGIYISGKVFNIFFEVHRDAAVAFLLGCLLASIRSILNNCPKVNYRRFLILLCGLILGLMTAQENFGVGVAYSDVSYTVLFIGGAIASSAMIIPGIPGSSVLIIMDIYDSLLFYISELYILKLISFGIGSIIGMIFLVKFLAKIYENHRSAVSYFFSGIVLGSSRALFPSHISITIVILFLVGFSIVWVWSDK